MDRLKPIACGISEWDGGKEIIYRCPNCGQDFRLLNEKNKYCFNCGQAILWDAVMLKLSSMLSQQYHATMDRDKRLEIIRQINHQNGINGGGANK